MMTDPPSPWKKSKAKKILYDDIMSGRTALLSGPTAVYHSRPEFERYKQTNFVQNYRTLRKAIQTRRVASNAGRQAFAHDYPIILERRNQSGQFFYNGSTLERQLRHDVQRGLTDGKKPTAVRNMRQVYQNQNVSHKQFVDFLWHERRRHQRNLQNSEYRERMRFINARIGDDNA